MCDKSKRSKTILTIIRNHQYDVDGKGYRTTIYGDSNIRYQSLSGPMRQSDTIDYRIFTQTTLRDYISETNRDALEKLQMALIAQEEEYSAHEVVEVQITDNFVEVETTSTEPVHKPKSNKRKWLFGLGASTVLAGIITLVIKK